MCVQGGQDNKLRTQSTNCTCKCVHLSTGKAHVVIVCVFVCRYLHRVGLYTEYEVAHVGVRLCAGKVQAVNVCVLVCRYVHRVGRTSSDVHHVRTAHVDVCVCVQTESKQ